MNRWAKIHKLKALEIKASKVCYHGKETVANFMGSRMLTTRFAIESLNYSQFVKEVRLIHFEALLK